jgi:twitching motility two-component system response regulator PilG
MQTQTHKTILLVDDNQALLQTTQAMLGTSHWRCEARTDSIDALCAIVESRPKAVLIDSEAAPLDAWKFCLLVKEHPVHAATRVIILCSVDDALVRARANAAGADGVLTLPFAAEDLLVLLGENAE